VRVIFLDIDGVLNSHRTVESRYRLPTPIDADGDVRMAAKLDPIAIGLVNRLAVMADAKIVICSAWRIGSTLDGLKTLLGNAGLISERIIGMTDTNLGLRGEQIARYLDKFSDIENYVWLDDDGDCLPGQNLIQTKHEDGLAWRDYVAACKVFGHNPFEEPKATP